MLIAAVRSTLEEARVGVTINHHKWAPHRTVHPTDNLPMYTLLLSESIMKRIISLVVLALFAVPALAAELEIVDTPGKYCDIKRDGKPLVRYMYEYDDTNETTKHATYKVYYHVMDPTGKIAITKGPGGQYTHHRGMFIGFAKLKSQGKTSDLWHMKDGALQKHVKFLKQEATDDKAVLSSLIAWTTNDGTIVEETRTLTVHRDDKAHMVADFVSELKAVGSDAEFNGDPEHAGMQFRPSNKVSGNKSAKYVFHTEDAKPTQDLDLPWAALTYELGDATYSVQHMNHPDNPKKTRYSAYRDYGRFGAFAVFTVKENETGTLRYRIRITEGDTPSREALAAQYKNFAK
jgi:hypothetical protein